MRPDLCRALKDTKKKQLNWIIEESAKSDIIVGRYTERRKKA